jgi:dihydroxyacetone kinase-like protein
MPITPAIFPELITAIDDIIKQNADAVTELDQAIGDGDHVFNLQRGLQALQSASIEISQLDWSAAWQKIGMVLMASVGGASGSLYATLFISLSKNSLNKNMDFQTFADSFTLAVEAVKQRGKSDVGEKTMLDVLVPVAESLKAAAQANQDLAASLTQICQVAENGVENTRNLLATKGRASFLGERSLGHIDAGAKTAQLMISSIAGVLSTQL